MSFDLTVRFLGTEVFAITIGRTEAAADAPRMEAGSGHNFERDMAPPDPLGEEPWTDNRFGFGVRA